MTCDSCNAGIRAEHFSPCLGGFCRIGYFKVDDFWFQVVLFGSTHSKKELCILWMQNTVYYNIQAILFAILFRIPLSLYICSRLRFEHYLIHIE